MTFKHLLAGVVFIGIVGYGVTSYATGATTQKETFPPSTKEVSNQLQKSKTLVTNTKQDPGILSPQELTAITGDIIAKYGGNLTKEQLNAYIEVQVKLIEHLRSFKVTGMGVSGLAVDRNLALIYNNQNPTFDIYFKNTAGEIKKRTYQASIKSLGMKIECALNFQLFFFINTNLNFFDANTRIPLSWGGEFTIPLSPTTHREDFANFVKDIPKEFISDANTQRFFAKPAEVVDLPFFSLVSLSCTYASIKNNGGLFVVTLGFGPKLNIASVVIGGSLEPIVKSTLDTIL